MKNILMLICIALVTSAIQAQNQQDISEEDRSYLLNINDTAANFSVELLDGQHINLSDLKGKVVMLNFWATWCKPCLMEFTELPSKIFTKFQNDEFVFITISRGETKEIVRKGVEKLKSQGININSGIDPDKKIWQQYATSLIPKNFIIDKNGIIQYVSTGFGPDKVEQLAAAISRLL